MYSCYNTIVFTHVQIQSSKKALVNSSDKQYCCTDHKKEKKKSTKTKRKIKHSCLEN